MADSKVPETMRALAHDQKLQTLTLVKDQEVPVPHSNEILLKVASAAITSGELDWPRPPELNQSCPGTDMAGSVVSAPSSSKFKARDKVYMRTAYPRPGSAREYSIGLEKELAFRPKNISADEAAAVPVSALTAWQAFFIHAGFASPLDQQTHAVKERNVRVLVNGASGASGLWMTQMARLAGCHVIGTCSNKNAALVKELGADETVDYTTTSISEWARTNGKVDIVIDCVGGKSQDECWHAIQDHGKLISIAPSADMVWRWELSPPQGVSSTITGKFFIMDSNSEDLGHITKLIEEGRVRPVIDSTYTLEEYEKAFERMSSRRAVGKIVFKISDEN